MGKEVNKVFDGVLLGAGLYIFGIIATKVLNRPVSGSAGY